MKTIYKYILDIKNEQLVKFPADSLIIDCQNQKDNIVIYAIVDTEQEKTVERKIEIYGTGNPIKDPENLNWLATRQIGDFVVHVFERYL